MLHSPLCNAKLFGVDRVFVRTSVSWFELTDEGCQSFKPTKVRRQDVVVLFKFGPVCLHIGIILKYSLDKFY